MNIKTFFSWNLKCLHPFQLHSNSEALTQMKSTITTLWGIISNTINNTVMGEMCDVWTRLCVMTPHLFNVSVCQWWEQCHEWGSRYADFYWERRDNKQEVKAVLTVLTFFLMVSYFSVFTLCMKTVLVMDTTQIWECWNHHVKTASAVTVSRSLPAPDPSVICTTGSDHSSCYFS